MNITVVLCTYNRCQSLAKALESVAGSALPDSIRWEVLVVDNNSRDKTREVVEDFSRRHPGRFRYLFEPHPGKSYALNSGILAAAGDVLAFIDDDVIVDPHWLQKLSMPLNDGEWAGSGGRILPQQAVSPPRWLPIGEAYATAPLVMFDLGPDAGQLTVPPFGTNMAFQKRLFDKYGGFRTDLGPQPGSEIRSEDTEFGSRLLAAGERLRYEPSAIVYHVVPEHRLQKRYFLTWWFDKARGDIRAFGTPPDMRWHVAGVPMVEFRRLAAWMTRWLLAFQPPRRFASKLNVWIVAGRIVESHRIWRRAPETERRNL